MKKTIVLEIKEKEAGILISALTLMDAIITNQIKAPLMVNEPLPMLLSLSEHQNATRKVLKKLRRIEKAATESSQLG